MIKLYYEFRTVLLNDSNNFYKDKLHFNCVPMIGHKKHKKWFNSVKVHSRSQIDSEIFPCQRFKTLQNTEHR